MNASPPNARQLPRQAADLLERVRTRSPRVHCLMNTVVQKLVADGISAMGGIPSMTSAPDEVQGFAKKADALLVNLGTLDAQRREATRIAVREVAQTGKPWVVDPAHCDYSPPRAAFAQQLLAHGPTVLRANSAEFRLLRIPSGATAVETGETDRVSFGETVLAVENGHPLMAKVTGTGCLSGALIAAFLAVENDGLIATASALIAMGVAAQIAATHARGPGSFEPALLDEIAALRGEDIIEHAGVGDAQRG